MANIPVHAGGNLQAALNSAVAGDVILLDADATYEGYFRAPVHSGTSYITVQTDAVLPGATTRVSPTTAAGFAKLKAPGAAPSCFDFALTAHHWKLLGLGFPQIPTGQGECISLGFGDKTQNTLASVPHHLTVDRCWIYGDLTKGGQKRGIGVNAQDMSILNCYIEKCVRAGQDAQALGGWNGPGPLTVTNCYLEASGENILLGGDSARIPNLVTTNVSITKCHLKKPLSWRTDYKWTVKNLFELKNADTVLFDSNLVEGCWVSGQTGSAIVLTPRNQNGDNPWVIVQNVTISNNVIRSAANAFNILGTDNLRPSLRSKNLTIDNNLLYDIDGPKYGGGFGMFLQINAPDTLTVTHNTAICVGRYTMYFDGTTPGFSLLDNIMTRGSYGVLGAGTSEGSATFSSHAPSADIRKNCFVGASSSRYPANNFYPATLDDVQFVDRANNDYQLQP